MEHTHYKQEINITDALMTRINELIGHYPEDKIKSALLPVLHEVQDAHDNWLSIELQDKVAEILKLKPIEVYEVVTFYTMYNQVRGVECLGACGYAPMMQLGDFYKEHLNEEKIDQLITDCKENKITLHDK